MRMMTYVQSKGQPANFEMKTDLNLLLECLKFQMDSPESQSDALAAVRSICQNSCEASEHFREIGGLIFTASLAKSSSHSVLKEASLYTLAVLADNSVFCQQALSSLELFEDVYGVLSDEESAVSLKRISVFLLLVLVSNNKVGQALARESGCLDLLLCLFGSSFIRGMLLSVVGSDPQYQLWLSVCSTLCACVNNPQNEENQQLCSSAFPQADMWLQQSVRPDIVRPVCSLIGLSVANNRLAQDHFTSIGGLDTLANVLLKLMNTLQAKLFSTKLAVVVTKSLDACAAGNARAIQHLSKHKVISSLTTLLSRHLDPEDRFSVVLALGHFTEDCEPNQYELLRSNGPLIIQVLTEAQDEEEHKAATFVLQNCRRMTEMLSLSLDDLPKTGEETVTPAGNTQKDMDDFWKTAKEIYHKIQHLQRQHSENAAEARNPGSRRSSRTMNQEEATAALPARPCSTSLPQLLQQPCQFAQTSDTQSSSKQCLDNGVSAHRGGVPMEKVSGQMQPDTAESRTSRLAEETISDKSTALQEAATDLMGPDQSCASDPSRKHHSSRDAFTQTAIHHVTDASPDSQIQPPEGEHIHPPRPQACSTWRKSGRKSPLIKEATYLLPQQCGQTLEDHQVIDPLTCADIISEEISSHTGSSVSLSQMRCAGCFTGISMNSKNCSRILLECPSLCDRHRVILQAEERHKTELKKLLHGTRNSTWHQSIQLTPVRKEGANSISGRFLMTPIKKVTFERPHQEMSQNDLQNSEQQKRSPKKKQKIINRKQQPAAVENPKIPDAIVSHKEPRKDFTQKEIENLLDGVRKFGRHWNAILWSYPFQKGRKNVDLAKKYKQLQQGHLKSGE